MKRHLFCLAVAVSIMMPNPTQAADGNVRVKGELKGITDSLIVFTPMGGDNFRQDTVLVKDGKFEFTVNVSEPITISAYTPATVRREGNSGFQLVAVPGESAVLSGDVATEYHVSGSKFYEQYNEGARATSASRKAFDDFYQGLRKRMQAGESQETLMKEFEEKAPALQQRIVDDIFGFIRQHPDYEAAAAFIPNLQDAKQMEEAIQLLSPAVRDGRMKPFYQKPFELYTESAKAEAEAAKKQAAGVEAPDFTLNDINGKPLTLSSLRGKYVILDFWGSWCGWCIVGFPKMKTYYEKYKDNIEILGIDCNDTEAKWRDAVKKHELPWLHVYNPNDSKVLDDYGIQGFPTKIVVGPDGKIVKTVVGEDPSFYAFLDETFAK